MTKHDYKDTLATVKEIGNVMRGQLFVKLPLTQYELEAIRHALLLADKMMQEPSEEMRMAALNDCAHGGYIGKFKAMRDQALKEIEDGE